MFKRFSTREVSDALISTVVRFPFVIAAAALGTALAVNYIEHSRDWERNQSIVIGAMVCLLALPFLLSLKFISESYRFNKAVDAALQVGGVALLVLYWYLLPDRLDDAPEKHWFRYGALVFAAHLLVSFAPFFSKGHNTAFWDFNQQLFFRWLIGALYAGVLFLGITAALAAIDALFNVDVKPERYGQLWFLCAGLFHPLFFLSGMPRTFINEEQELNYPKALRWFAVYILVPIVIVYLAILYTYFGKIGIEWNFPRGWVANLGLGFSVTGILALLLVYPLREREDQPFIRLYYRWYFVLLIPVVVLVLLAIGKRISQYGFTEERYAVLALSLWLAFLAAYIIVISRHRIKVIPITLFVIALASAWLMSPVSRSSQMQRLKTFLATENMLDENGKIVKPATSINDSTVVEISRITRYLANVHSPRSLQPLFHQPVREIVDSVKHYEDEQTLVAAMGLNYKYYVGLDRNNFVSYNRTSRGEHQIRGFDVMVDLNTRRYKRGGHDSDDKVELDGKALSIAVIEDTRLEIQLPDRSVRSFDIHAFMQNLHDQYGTRKAPDHSLVINDSTDDYRFRVVFTSLHGYKETDTLTLNGFDAYLLIGKN